MRQGELAQWAGMEKRNEFPEITPERVRLRASLLSESSEYAWQAILRPWSYRDVRGEREVEEALPSPAMFSGEGSSALSVDRKELMLP